MVVSPVEIAIFAAVRNLIIQQRFFLIPYLIFLLTGIVFIAYTGRADGHLILNTFIFDAFNTFFALSTHIGDGLTLGIIVFILLFWRFKSALFLGLSGALSGTVTQLLKNNVFDEIDRPYQYFKFYDPERRALNLVLNASEMHIHNSFPSGHATTAFCLFLGLSILSQKPKAGLVFILVSMVIAYSRVYLSQHFLQDIIAGSLIAVVCTLMVALMIEYLEKRYQPDWFAYSLIKWKS
jgi:membrane-associated phospholipid phosphatase